jgi:hypothetical protein
MDFNFDRSWSGQPLWSGQLSENSRSRRSKDPRFSYNSSLLVPTGSSDTHAFTEPQNRNPNRLNLGFGRFYNENWHRRSGKATASEVLRGTPEHLRASHGGPRGPPVAAERRARCKSYAGAPASHSRQSEGQRLYGIILVILTSIRVTLLVAAARVLVRRTATLRQPQATAMEPIKPCVGRRRRSRANGACVCWKVGSSQKVMRLSTKEFERMWITTFSSLAKLRCWRRRRQRRRAPPCRPSRWVRPAAAL